MPELPEVETTVRALATQLEGAVIAHIVTHRADLRRPFPVDLGQRMTGARVTAITRRAKYGIIATDRDDSLIFHLGMSGRWRIDADVGEKHDHLTIELVGGRRLALNDPRRFGSVDLVAGDPAISFAPFTALGPEPLGPDFDANRLASAIAGKRTAIKLLLLDQRIVAGLGNIYVCEALHLAGVAPTLAGDAVPRAKLPQLVDSIRFVLNAAIAAGGSSMRDFVHPDGKLGYFRNEWRVYGRAADPCPVCATAVVRLVQGGRSTFYCPRCQR